MVYVLTFVFLICNVFMYLQMPSAAEELQAWQGQKITVQGRIEGLSVRQYDTGTSFLVNCEQTEINGRQVHYEKKLRVFAKEQITAAGRVQVQGMLKPINGYDNPGGFDLKQWLKVNKLGGRISQAQIQQLSGELTLAEKIESLNVYLRKALNQKLDNRQAAVLGGMLLGGSGELAEEDRELFSNQGMAHLLSVSGTHLLLWSAFLNILLGIIPGRPRKLLILSLLGGYALLCGLRPPVVRAWGMSALLLWGDHKGNKNYLLCFLLMLMLTINPLWIGDIGFQLSFGATAGIIFLLPKCQQLWKNILPAKLDYVAEGLGVTTAAQLLVVPLEIAYFHQLSLISLVSNMLLVPVLELSNILAAMGLVISETTGLNQVLELAGWLVEQLLYEARLLSALPCNTLVIGCLPLWNICLYYGFIGCWADGGWFSLLENLERYGSMAVLGAIILTCYGCLYWLPGKLTVYFLDVGQGDAAVILTPRKKVVVIDTGGLNNYDTGSRILVPMLKSLGKSEVDLLIPSHSDFDHIGGGGGLARNLPIRNILLPNENYSSAGKANLQALLTMAGQARLEKATHKIIRLEEGIELEIYPGNPELSSNDASTVVALNQNGQPRALFTGDLSSNGEESLKLGASYPVLKVGHHGAKTSTGHYLLEQVRPKLAVISCGKDNRYGHPHQETLARLKEAGAVIARTDQQGCIQVEFAGNNINWKCYGSLENSGFDRR